MDDYCDKFLGHLWPSSKCRSNFQTRCCNGLNGILLHMFLIYHMGLSFGVFACKELLCKIDHLPWLGDGWGMVGG